jgi:hypothetical protein
MALQAEQTRSSGKSTSGFFKVAHLGRCHVAELGWALYAKG